MLNYYLNSNDFKTLVQISYHNLPGKGLFISTIAHLIRFVCKGGGGMGYAIKPYIRGVRVCVCHFQWPFTRTCMWLFLFWLIIFKQTLPEFYIIPNSCQ